MINQLKIAKHKSIFIGNIWTFFKTKRKSIATAINKLQCLRGNYNKRKSVIRMIRSWRSSGPLLQAVALLLLPLAAARPDTGFTAFHPQVRLLDAMVDVQQVIMMLF